MSLVDAIIDYYGSIRFDHNRPLLHRSILNDGHSLHKEVERVVAAYPSAVLEGWIQFWVWIHPNSLQREKKSTWMVFVSF